MKLTQPQQVICESLLAESLTVKDIITATGFSGSYVRAQIKQLEVYGRIEKVDTRQPYLYKLTDTNPFVVMQDKIEKYRYLLSEDAAETENSFVKLLRMAPKEEWPIIADELRAITETIDILETEGKLVDTLEGLLK